jgi:hypothetical protein
MLFIDAMLWLFISSLAAWGGFPSWQLSVIALTQSGWIIGAGLLARWGWARPATVLYALFGLALSIWSAWVGSGADYTAADWVVTALVAAIPLLAALLVLIEARGGASKPD